MSPLVTLAIIASVLQITHGSNLTLFFENVDGISGTSRRPFRENATGSRTLHLYQGDLIDIRICLNKSISFRLGGLKLSNDGGKDMLDITLNNFTILSIPTEEKIGGFGAFWDNFTEFVLNDWYVTLDAGDHVLGVSVSKADCYGVELDTLTLTTDVQTDEEAFFCGKSLFPAAEGSPCEPITATTETTPQSSSTALHTSLSTILHTSLSTILHTSLSTTPPTAIPFVEQLSTTTQCLDEENVNIKFNPKKLVGLEISAFSDLQDIVNTSALPASLPPGPDCTGTVWTLGKADMSNSEFNSAAPTDKVLDFTVTSQTGDTSLFPGEIDPSQTKEVIIRYTIPAGILVEHGKVYFTLGLKNVTKDTAVGLQYYDRSRAKKPDIEYVVFRANMQALSWDLPAMSISPSLENQLHLLFRETDSEPIRFDFLRLDTLTKSDKTKPRILAKSKLFRIRGVVYSSTKRNPATKGMSVVVDGKESKNVDMFSLSVRPKGKGRQNSVLTINKEGKIIPQHDSRRSVRGIRKIKTATLPDLSGFIFGDGNSVKYTYVDTVNQQVKIVYSDETFLNFSFQYSADKTTLVLLESSISENTLRFVSTHLTDRLSAVNVLVATDEKDNATRHIKGNLDDVTFRQINFYKTSTNPMFKASPKITITFPEGTV